MARIRENAEQKQALNDVQEALATIKLLNCVLVPNSEIGVSINFEAAIGKRTKPCRLAFGPDDKEYSALIKILQAQKSKLVKEINTKSSKFDIKLDKEDRLIMGPAAQAVAALTAGTSQEEEHVEEVQIADANAAGDEQYDTDPFEAAEEAQNMEAEANGLAYGGDPASY